MQKLRPKLNRELIKFGWFLMDPGYEFESNTMLLTQSSNSEYEKLCRLDVLGFEDTPEHDQSVILDELKEQLTQSPEGWYETTLPWRPGALQPSVVGLLFRFNRLGGLGTGHAI